MASSPCAEVNVRPLLHIRDVSALIRDHFGLQVSVEREFNSYDDKNVLTKEKAGGRLLVVKVLNGLDSKNPEIVDAQHALALFLRDHGFVCPVPITTPSGEYRQTIELPADCDDQDLLAEFILHVWTFVPGSMIADVTYTASLLHSAGRYVGRMNKRCMEFSHPFYGKAISRIWDLKRLPDLQKFVGIIKDAEHHAVITSIIHDFIKLVMPVYSQLKSGIIHGDCTDQNILVKDTKDAHGVSAILDFGDTCHSFYVFELAILIMTLMDHDDDVAPLDVGGHVIAGYLTDMELNQTEVSVLKLCVEARFAQSLVMGEHTSAMHPDNTYTLTTAARGWQRITALRNITQSDLYQRWSLILKSYGLHHFTL